MAGIPYRTGNLLYWNYFQRRGGESKRPFFIFWPVQIPCPAASTGRRDRESLKERALWGESIHYVKSILGAIKNLTQFSQDRFSDKELGKFLYQRVAEDIDKTDLLLSGLLNSFQVATPIKKGNTVNALIEEVLEKNKVHLEEKRAHLFKRLEENLPEIIVPDEQLKYILKSVLQYVILSIPPNGNIELLTTSSIFQRDPGGTQAFFERFGGYIEISAAFSGAWEPVGQPTAALGRTPFPQKDGALEFILQLVKGTVLKNWGKMNFETDKKEGKTILSLRFPLERRNVVFYPPTQKTTDFASG